MMLSPQVPKQAAKKTLSKLGIGFYRVRKQHAGETINAYQFFSQHPEEAETLMQFVFSLIVQEGDVTVDVGANRGLHTVMLSQLVGSKGKVYAFEPTPVFEETMKKIPKLSNVIHRTEAVTSSEVAQQHAEIQFHYFPNRDGYSGLKLSAKSGFDSQVITVKTTTLDQALGKQISPKQRLSFIKIDVEGADFDVLLGAKKLLSRHKPVVIIENGRQSSADLFGYTKKQFFEYLNGLGYQLFQFTGQPFTEADWTKKDVYWETWLVHRNSPHFKFFQDHYSNLLKVFLSNSN